MAKEIKIVVDPGHGYGKAHNRGGLLFNEGDQNFKLGWLIIKEIRRYNGVKVISTRNSQYDNPSLSQRARMAVGTDLFISTHTNAGVSNATGIEIFRSKYNTTAGNDMINRICSSGSKIMDIRNRGIKFWTYDGGDYWGVFNWGNNATNKMLIEWAFHTNMRDSKQYLANQVALARLVAREIARTYNLSLKAVAAQNTATSSSKKEEGKKLYRVQLGAFENKANAEKYLQTLAKAGFRGIIVGEDTYKSPVKKIVAPKKTLKQIAKEVLAGKWGNGEVRKKKLKAAGYDYNQVQKEVNNLL